MEININSFEVAMRCLEKKIVATNNDVNRIESVISKNKNYENVVLAYENQLHQAVISLDCLIWVYNNFNDAIVKGE